MKEAYDQKRDCFSIILFLFLSFFIPRICKITGGFVISTMAVKMKGIYKGFKCISQIFGGEKERDEIEIGYPTNVKHVAHIGWEGSSGSAPDWMNEFKVGAEILSPRPSSFSNNARPSTSFFTSSSTDFDLNTSQRTISDTLKDIPPITPKNLPKHNNKKSTRKKKKSSSSSTSPKSSRSSVLSKSSYKSTVSQIN